MGYALRTTAALLLAYYVAFAMQLDSASSAGVCVAIVAQPTPGMALSKAFYRAAGTVLGGAAALAIMAAFPQDRTMLLLAFTLWLSGCTFVAALLRDFRSYGAVLCGYTAGIIALTEIDSPGGALTATLNRVAAILLGIACVALVNLLSRPAAFEDLVADLRDHLAQAEGLARLALSGTPLPAEPLPARTAASILELRTPAIYAAAELAEGRLRSTGAKAAISGLLGMLSASRAIGTGLSLPTPAPARAALARLALDGAPPPVTSLPADAHSAALLDRSRELLVQHRLALDGLRMLDTGHGAVPLPELPVHRDGAGAVLSALRTLIAVGLGCVFCIYSGWADTTGLLVQQAAFTALLGMQANPTASGMAMGWSLIPAAAAAGIIGFALLPSAAEFPMFALALAPFALLMALAARHPRTARFGPGLLLYLVLLLSPSNTESFDLASFYNTVLQQAAAVVFMVLAFQLVLPVSPRRRLARVADAVGAGVRQAYGGHGRRRSAAGHRNLRIDRLAQAQVWLGRPTRARLAVLERLSAFVELESALRRARTGLVALGLPMPDGGPAAFAAAAQAVLDRPCPPGREAMVLHAASGLYGASLLLHRHGRALRRYGVLDR